MCGKDLSECIGWAQKGGSPPRVRERQKTFQNVCGKVGITPACAGKTHPFGLPDELLKDHPRVCGKDLAKTYTLMTRLGSPPRVRERRNRD